MPSPLDEADYQDLENMVNLNIGPYVYLTRALLPRMLKREKRSGIIFNGSIAAAFVSPSMSIYSGSKAFVDHFTKCLAYENPNKIDVLSYKPNMVETNLVKIKSSFFVLTPTEAANSALDKLGWDVETEGHWRHACLNAKMRAKRSVLPERVSMEISNKRMRQFAEMIKGANRNKA